MNNLCNHCGICCKLIPVDLYEHVILRDGMQTLDDNFAQQLVPLSENEALTTNKAYVEKVQSIFQNAKFFKCKYLSEENLCKAVEKPNICTNFPSHPLAIIPDECGYYGENFLKSEKVKQKVRRYKEEILYYEAMIQSGCKDEKTYRKIIASLQRFIDKYIPYGAENW